MTNRSPQGVSGIVVLSAAVVVAATGLIGLAVFGPTAADAPLQFGPLPDDVPRETVPVDPGRPATPPDYPDCDKRTVSLYPVTCNRGRVRYTRLRGPGYVGIDQVSLSVRYAVVEGRDGARKLRVALVGNAQSEIQDLEVLPRDRLMLSAGGRKYSPSRDSFPVRLREDGATTNLRLVFSIDRIALDESAPEGPTVDFRFSVKNPIRVSRRVGSIRVPVISAEQFRQIVAPRSDGDR